MSAIVTTIKNSRIKKDEFKGLLETNTLNNIVLLSKLTQVPKPLCSDEEMGEYWLN